MAEIDLIIAEEGKQQLPVPSVVGGGEGQLLRLCLEPWQI